MAVFTQVNPDAFSRWARQRLGFARVGPLSPVAEGIENTNYRFAADGRDFIFTIFEVWDAARVGYYAALARHFAARRMPTPSPLDANMPDDWNGKPCLVVPFAPGAQRQNPGADECRLMGETAARLHLAAADFPDGMPNPRGTEWRKQAAAQIQSDLSPADRELLRGELACDAKFSARDLPSADCHCDLFRNNVLWNDGRVSAVIDFYFGGRDALLFDLAVCCCDWCFDFASGDFNDAKLAAMLCGYRKVRPLTSEEEAAFPDALRIAALRFWISRLHDLKFPRRSRNLVPHDPAPFRTILQSAKLRAENGGRRAQA